MVSDANPVHPGHAHIVSFLDSFTHPGPENHICIVFEPLGENLLALIERNKKKGVSLPLVKLIARQVLLGLQYLHDECDLVHTDIKPENIRMPSLNPFKVQPLTLFTSHLHSRRRGPHPRGTLCVSFPPFTPSWRTLPYKVSLGDDHPQPSTPHPRTPCRNL